ncbi:MAG TPA: DUF4034 domain-containing protein [Candidatus Acidoferrum sp.]|jgi:hypothetical protein
MFCKRLLTFLLALSVCLAGISCGKKQAFANLDSATLLDIARKYNPATQPGHVLAAAPLTKVAAVAPDKLPTVQEYASSIKQAFSQGNYDQLEKIIKEARESKGRILGGNWKVLEFYVGVYETFLGPNADESDWKMFFDSLNQWVKTKPESAAARLCLAEAYVGYAWKARGSGYADSVTDHGWELFRERVAMASATLAEAARLKEKCPFWYETMQTVALAQGWDKSQTRELMELGIAYEPDYYHFYREHANSLQTKWYGDEGEIESFTEEVSDRVSGPKGDILYFELSSLVACQCEATKDAIRNLSWPRIKQGYAALGQMYGISSIKRNRFASMAVKAGDKTAARAEFVEMGATWDKDIWISADKYERAKAWAMSE